MSINLEAIDTIFAGRESAIARDLKLNLKKFLEEGALSPEQALMTVLATAVSTGAKPLEEFARTSLQTANVPEDQIREAAESAAMMGMLNVYYRFRHMVNKADDYSQAGLRMTALARPAMGKENWEMLALAVSAINGCEKCITSHEQALRDAGVGADKIHDLARIAAIVKGISGLLAIA